MLEGGGSSDAPPEANTPPGGGAGEHKGGECKQGPIALKLPKHKVVTRHFVIGEQAMTMEGAVVILDYTSDPTGNHPCIYSCLEADVTEPPKVKTIPADDRLIWSIKDFPEWHFGGDAPHLNISEKWREKQVRVEDIHFPEIDLDAEADKSSEPRPQKAAYHYGTRSKAKGGGYSFGTLGYLSSQRERENRARPTKE